MRMVGITPHGDQWLDPGLLARRDVVGAEIARVDECLLHLDQVRGQRPQALKHRHHLLFVIHRLGDPGRHDEETLGIDNRLGVVALLEAAPGDRHNPRRLIGEVGLIRGARNVGRRLRGATVWLAPRDDGALRPRFQFGLMPRLFFGEASGRPRFKLGLRLGNGRQAHLNPLQLRRHAHRESSRVVSAIDRVAGPLAAGKPDRLLGRDAYIFFQ